MSLEPVEQLLQDAARALTPRRLERIRAAAAARLDGLAVAFDSVHDPHNISAALRSCDAFGVQRIHLAGPSRDVLPNRGVTKGCERWLSFHWHETAAECVAALRGAGYRVLLAMQGDDSLALEDVDFGQRVALVFGNEHSGVSEDFKRLADGCYHIPMVGFVESLNVSVAVAVSLSHAAAARRRAVGGPTDMAPEANQRLLAGWLRRELDARKGWRAE